MQPAHTTRQTQDWLTGQLYRLHCKGWMATKFTRPQRTWLSCVGCNAWGISQTSLKAQDHSGAKKVHCSRSVMTCRRQRSTKLLTTFANVWTHEPRPVMDIWNRWYKLYTQIFRLNSFSETVNKLSVLTRCLSSNSKVHDRCVVKSENSLGGWLRLIWHNFVKFRDNWIKFCHLA